MHGGRLADAPHHPRPLQLARLAAAAMQPVVMLLAPVACHLSMGADGLSSLATTGDCEWERHRVHGVGKRTAVSAR